jgi:hypothetical protein
MIQKSRDRTERFHHVEPLIGGTNISKTSCVPIAQANMSVFDRREYFFEEEEEDMRYIQRSWNRAFTYGLIGSLALVTFLILNESDNTSANTLFAPTIKITLVPRRGPGGDGEMATIGGSTGGIEPSKCKCKVVVYARTDKWYVQPYIKSPHTTITDDGSWQTDTHLGYEYAALLVNSNYKNPPPETRVLPQVGGDVLATVRVEAK